MAKETEPGRRGRLANPATSSPCEIEGTSPGANPSMGLLDQIAEIVHQGYGRLFDADEVRAVLDGWQPHCSINYEYVFAWRPSFDPSSIEIDWDRIQARILRRAVKKSLRLEKIRSGSRMTKVEQQAYRLELARIKHGYRSAQECLESGTNCQWADLSFVTDSRGRGVYILEMADAVVSKHDSYDSIVERHGEIWRWKSQGLTTVGPFASSEKAEEWMAENGAFEEVD